MARAPQPAPLQSPLQRRSQYLADALEQMRQEPQNIGGWGGLGARLLAQGITQAAAGKTEDALSAERANADLARRQRIAALVGGNVEGAPQEVGSGRLGNPLSGLADLVRGRREEPAPASATMPQPSVAPTPDIQGQPLPQAMTPDAPASPASQSNIPPAFAQQVLSLLQANTPESIAQAEDLVNQYQSRQAMLSLAPDAVRNDPNLAFAYSNNPEAVAESIGYQYRPQVVAEGGLQSVVGQGQIVRNPRTREFGDSLVRDTPEGFEVLGSRGPTFSEQTARQKAEIDAELGRGRLALDESTAGYNLSPGEIRYGPGGAPVAENTNISAQAQAQQVERQARQQQASQAIIRQADNTISAVDRAIDQTGVWTAGPLSGLSRIGGTPAANLAATLDTIEANLSFQALAEMRAQSPTGGALGSITERELSLLGSTVASIRQSQSPDQLRRNLETIKGSLQRIRDAQERAAAQGGGQPGQGQRLTPEQASRLPPGTPFIGTDGVRRVRQ